jgi:integrase/recombinase XerD
VSEHKSNLMIQPVPASELAQEIKAFLVDRQARGLSQHTILFYQTQLRYLDDFLAQAGITDVLAVTPHHLRRFILALGETHNPNGVHAAYRAFRAFFHWYEAEVEPKDWRNPVRKVRPPKVPVEPLEPIALADLKRLLETCERKDFIGDRDRTILLSLLDTGCRAAEFVALNVGDLNLATGAVRVREGKGGKFRTVFVGHKARREIVRYLRYRGGPGAGEPLWLTVEGTRLTYGGLRQIVRRRAARVGLPEPGLHSFRRAFALACLRNGVDLISLQRLMGHADLSILRRYLAQTDADLQAAHQRGGPVDNLL